MAAAQYFEQVQKIFIAFYQRPADPAGLKYWAQRVDAAGGDFGAVIDAFAASPEAVELYDAIDATTIGGVIDKLYLALFNTTPDAAGKKFYVDGFIAGTFSAGTIALNVLNGATGDDAVAVANKVQVANNFTQQVDGRPLTDAYFGTGTSFNVTYAGDTDAQAARDILKGVTFGASTVLSPSQVTELLKTKIADATDPIIGQTGGQTFTLTTSIDNLTGTTGNDTFLADSSTSSAADQINGAAGTDTFKTYDTGLTKLPTLKNVEVLQVAGAVTNADQNLSAYTKAVTGVEKVVFDDVTALSAKIITTTAGQSLSLATGASNLTTAGAVTWAASATDAALNLVLNGYQGKAATAANLTVTGAQATTLNIASTGAANKVGTFTGPVSVTKHVITGDQSFGYALAAADAAKVTTIDASAATGNVSADTKAGTLDKSFVFTGGTGNDTLTLTATSLQALTAGSQLDGGTGKDTLALSDSTYTVVAKDYTAINAAKGFEVLALEGNVDASKLTAIKEFAVSTGTNVISKVATGSTLNILAATTTTVSGQVGTTDLSINIGTAATATGITNSALDVTGLTNITITANKLATSAAAHSVGTLTNSDNSTFTLKGNADLTIALANASTTGSKVDGSAATGKLNITGNNGAFAANSSKGDILIGGSNDDIIKAGLNSSTLTGNAGKDAFNVSVSVAGATAPTANITTITDLVKGETIAFADASGTSAFTSTKLDVSTATTLAAALDLAAATNVTATNAAVKWFQFGGDTYVVQDLSTATALAATDVVVKLVGAQDLSTATLSGADVLTW